jgi:hypothetical protein
MTLIPCPFCNGSDIDADNAQAGNTVLHFRFCVGCGAQGPDCRLPEEATAGWNARAGTATAAYAAAARAIDGSSDDLRDLAKDGAGTEASEEQVRDLVRSIATGYLTPVHFRVELRRLGLAVVRVRP